MLWEDINPWDAAAMGILFYKMDLAITFYALFQNIMFQKRNVRQNQEQWINHAKLFGKEQSPLIYLKGICVTTSNINKLGFMYDRNIKQFFEGNSGYAATK